MSIAFAEPASSSRTTEHRQIDWSAHATEPASTACRRPSALLVDDDALVRTLLGRALRERGVTVWTAVDGQQALALYRDHHCEIDLVLLDTHLSDGDAVEMLAALQAITPGLRACFLSGRIDSHGPEELLNAGAVHVFNRPFRPIDLAQVIRDLLGDQRTDFQNTQVLRRFRTHVGAEQPGLPGIGSARGKGPMPAM